MDDVSALILWKAFLTVGIWLCLGWWYWFLRVVQRHEAAQWNREVKRNWLAKQ